MKFLASITLTLMPVLSLIGETKKVTITGNDTMQFDLKTIEAKLVKKSNLPLKMLEKFQRLQWVTTWSF